MRILSAIGNRGNRSQLTRVLLTCYIFCVCCTIEVSERCCRFRKEMPQQWSHWWSNSKTNRHGSRCHRPFRCDLFVSAFSSTAASQQRSFFSMCRLQMNHGLKGIWVENKEYEYRWYLIFIRTPGSYQKTFLNRTGRSFPIAWAWSSETIGNFAKCLQSGSYDGGRVVGWYRVRGVGISRKKKLLRRDFPWF